MRWQVNRHWIFSQILAYLVSRPVFFLNENGNPSLNSACTVAVKFFLGDSGTRCGSGKTIIHISVVVHTICSSGKNNNAVNLVLRNIILIIGKYTRFPSICSIALKNLDFRVSLRVQCSIDNIDRDISGPRVMAAHHNRFTDDQVPRNAPQERGVVGACGLQADDSTDDQGSEHQRARPHPHHRAISTCADATTWSINGPYFAARVSLA